MFLIHRDRTLGFQRKFSIDPQCEENDFSLDLGHEGQTLPKPTEKEPSLSKPRAWETSLSLSEADPMSMSHSPSDSECEHQSSLGFRVCY